MINVIIPYFFYSKGDQKDSHKRVPITAKLVADLLRKAGASHVMIIEPHTPQLEGFFGTPVDALKVYNFSYFKSQFYNPNAADVVIFPKSAKYGTASKHFEENKGLPKTFQKS